MLALPVQVAATSVASAITPQCTHHSVACPEQLSAPCQQHSATGSEHQTATSCDHCAPCHAGTALPVTYVIPAQITANHYPASSAPRITLFTLEQPQHPPQAL